MTPEVDLNDLYFLVQVVDRGGFTAASRHLGVPKSRLSRRISELEDRLGVLLLSRTTRRVRLTEVGAAYAEPCRAMLQAAETAERVAAGFKAAPQGLLRVSMPIGLASTDLSGLISSFLCAYPDVHLDLTVTNRRVDMLDERIDVALRVRRTEDEDPNLVVRRLRPTDLIVVCAPRLLEGREIPTTAEAVGTLPMLRFGSLPVWPLTHRDGHSVQVPITPRLTSDDFQVLFSAAIEGVGVGLLPRRRCTHALRAGRLVRLLPAWRQHTGTLQAVYPNGRWLSPAARAFVEFLVERTATRRAPRTSS